MKQLKSLRKILFSFLFILFLVFFFGSESFALNSGVCERGIQDYRAENFEEALVEFKKCYNQTHSSVSAFYLGLCYKQIGEYEKALKFFKESLKLTPKVKDAYPELIQMLYYLGRTKEALHYIEEAEKLKFFPARISFLKGLVLVKMGKYAQARKAFEKAKKINPSYAKACDFQIALCYVRERQLKEAQKILRTLSSLSPELPVSRLAREYLHQLEIMKKRYRAFHIRGFVGYNYDTNINGAPSENIQGVDSPEEGSAWISSFTFLYQPFPEKRFNWLASFSFADTSYFQEDSLNTQSLTLNFTPSYLKGRTTFNFPLRYTYLWRDKDPYSISYLLGCRALRNVFSSFLLQSGGYFTFYDLRWKIYAPEENRDAKKYQAFLGFLRPFNQGKGLISFKYQYTLSDAEGSNWDFYANEIYLTFLYPLTSKLTFTLGGSLKWQNYKNINTFTATGNSPPGFPSEPTKRKDTVTFVTTGFMYRFYRYFQLQTTWSYLKNHSNFPLYDYSKHNFNVQILLMY